MTSRLLQYEDDNSLFFLILLFHASPPPFRLSSPQYILTIQTQINHKHADNIQIVCEIFSKKEVMSEAKVGFIRVCTHVHMYTCRFYVCMYINA